MPKMAGLYFSLQVAIRRQFEPLTTIVEPQTSRRLFYSALLGCFDAAFGHLVPIHGANRGHRAGLALPTSRSTGPSQSKDRRLPHEKRAMGHETELAQSVTRGAHPKCCPGANEDLLIEVKGLNSKARVLPSRW